MPPGFDFVPAVVKSHGCLHRDFVKFLKLVAEHVTNTAKLGPNVPDADLRILRGHLINSYYQRIARNPSVSSKLRA